MEFLTFLHGDIFFFPFIWWKGPCPRPEAGLSWGCGWGLCRGEWRGRPQVGLRSESRVLPCGGRGCHGPRSRAPFFSFQMSPRRDSSEAALTCRSGPGAPRGLVWRGAEARGAARGGFGSLEGAGRRGILSRWVPGVAGEWLRRSRLSQALGTCLLGGNSHWRCFLLLSRAET